MSTEAKNFIGEDLLSDSLIDSERKATAFSGDESAVPVAPHSQPSPVRAVSLNISRDEMNLAEFPLTVLSKRADPSVKTLEFTDTVKGKNGDVINRSWIITGADKFGLPTSSDDEVLLGLLKLTADDGLRNRKIHFTRYELLKILRWTTEGRSYARLQNALDRLSGVRIKASNAFYDNESKAHSTRNFGIIDAYEINDGRDTRPSFFTWSEVLFKSFQVGFIKKLDLEFYLDLQSAVSKRLYRYLDKHFWYRSKIQVNLFILAHEKIGVSRNYVYASSLRQQLEPALDELKEKGMLSSYEFVGKGKNTEIIMHAATAPRRTLSTTTAAEGGDLTAAGPGYSDSSNNSKRSNEPLTEDEAILRRLVSRGIMERQARRLVEGQPEDVLQRMAAIIEYFDTLVASSSHLVSKSPAGFLYRAVEKPLDFKLPSDRAVKGGNSKSSDGKSRGVKQTQPTFNFQSQQGTRQEPSRSMAAEQEQQYQAARVTAIQQSRASVDSAVLVALEAEVEAGLAKLRAHISAQRFLEAVQRGVDQKLLDMNSFPTLKEWARKRR
jgi:hypothetical protein